MLRYGSICLALQHVVPKHQNQWQPKKPNKFAHLLLSCVLCFSISTEICHQIPQPSQKLAASRNSHRKTIVYLSLHFFASKCALASDNNRKPPSPFLSFLKIYNPHTITSNDNNRKPFLSFVNLLIERQGMLCGCNLKQSSVT